jgi:hypothetical protein
MGHRFVGVAADGSNAACLIILAMEPGGEKVPEAILSVMVYLIGQCQCMAHADGVVMACTYFVAETAADYCLPLHNLYLPLTVACCTYVVVGFTIWE